MKQTPRHVVWHFPSPLAALVVLGLLLGVGPSCSGGGKDAPTAPTTPTTPVTATQLQLTTSAAGAASGAAFTTQPVVAVRDAGANTVTNATHVVTMTVSAGATIVGTATATAVNGVATFSTVGITGTAGTSYTLTFSASGLTSATQSITAYWGPVASLTAGVGFTCGVTSAGAAYCWGWNPSGQLGDNTTGTNRSTPVAVLGVGGGTALTFASLTAGFLHTCGVTIAGAAYCWGANGYGQLGDYTSTSSSTPVAVRGVGGGTALTFASLTAGGQHTCGLTSAGAAYCWGYNGYGQLGDNTTTNRSTPVAVLGVGGGTALTFASLTAGDGFTCGVTSAGAAYCWGYNATGQLGDNTTTTRSTPVAVLKP